MEKKTVTVIVPVYNVEDYLRKCVDSLLAQTFKDFDVVLVDDGSTDSSGRLCDEIACGHDFIKTVHKQNGGLSDARNAGYPYITGDYVLFLDSDDYLAPNALELLYGFAKSQNCDIVQGGFYYAYEDRLMYDNRWFEPDSKAFVLVRQKAMKELVKNNFLKNFAWGKLYRSDIVKQIGYGPE
ncbi:MAG: glycosyltransferase family 2 protein [Bacteroidales bacterium]|nr:glycosyltransferase family 2 protein [Bacteroidales bacterium]